LYHGPDSEVFRGINVTDWAALRREILDTFTPGPPIDEYDLFAGRHNTIQRLQDITIERGRHAVIFGERGVGKTSLANIFHKNLNTETQFVLPIFVNTDKGDQFNSLWRKVLRRIKRSDGDDEWWADEAYTGEITVDDVQLELSVFKPNNIPIIIIDEYDRVEDKTCRVLMTDILKGMINYGTNCTVILVGVADSILQLVHDHGSISRNLAQVPMERMSPSEIRDIIVTRVRRLRMRITEDTVWRISYFSAGLPFYAHSLGKYTALQAVAKQRISITEGDLMNSLDDCIADVDYIVTEGYTRATEKIYRKPNIFTKVLAACALCETNDLGQFTAADVEGPLSAIMGEPYRVPSFAFHLNEMSGPGRGNVLRKRGARRTYQYNFAEPAMQPFVIMKSLKDGIISRTLFEQFYVKRQGSLSI
jgi:DNA polymerase III delta prime subunit